MEEAPGNGKESTHSAHGNGMDGMLLHFSEGTRLNVFLSNTGL